MFGLKSSQVDFREHLVKFCEKVPPFVLNCLVTTDEFSSDEVTTGLNILRLTKRSRGLTQMPLLTTMTIVLTMKLSLSSGGDPDPCSDKIVE